MFTFRFISLYRSVSHYAVSGDGPEYRIEQDQTGAFGRHNGGAIPTNVCLAFQRWRDAIELPTAPRAPRGKAGELVCDEFRRRFGMERPPT